MTSLGRRAHVKRAKTLRKWGAVLFVRGSDATSMVMFLRQWRGTKAQQRAYRRRANAIRSAYGRIKT